MHHQGTNSGSGGGAANQGTTPPSIAPAPPPQSPQGQQQVQATQVQMQQQQQNNSGGGGGNAGGGGGGGAGGVQQQQNVGGAPNNNMATMSAAAIQQTQMQQQQQQMAPPQAPTPQTLTHPHSAMHQVSEWGHGRVQVIQQPLQNPTYLQQIYNTQGQLLMPGNIALHPAGMNPSIQSLGSLGFQFQTKAGGGGGGNAGGGGTTSATMVPVSCGTATLTVAGKLSGGGGGCSPIHHNHLHHHPTLLPTQVIAAGKPFQPNQLAQHMITTQGKSVLQAGQAGSFPGYTTIPTTSNQTLVISQLGVISSQPNILPAHAHGQGGKPGEMQKIMGAGGKSNVVSSNGMGGGGVGSGAGGKGGNNQQQQQQCVVSQPQLITTQAPTAAMLGSQAQLISPIQFPWQAFGTSLPQGIAWATPGGLQSPAALLTTQNPIFIRGAQPHDPSGQGGQGPTATQGGVFIQSPPPQAMATHNGMQTGNNAGGGGAGNQGNGNAQQHQGQQAQPQITHQIHHQHQLAMKVASVGTGSNRVGTMDGGGGGNTGGGTTMQANIQPKTSVASNVLPPRSISGLLPGSPGIPNIRPASSVSTQTGSSGGPGGIGIGQLQLQKGIGKVRIKPSMNRASPAPSMKADAANQTKPQPISPANMQHQTQHQQQLAAAVAAQVSVANRMILTSASSNGAPLLPDKGQQHTLQAVKTFTSSSASTTSTTTSTSTSCSPAPTLPILPPLGHPTATAVLLPHPSLQAQLLGQAGCPPSPSGNSNGPNVSVSSPMRPVGAPTPTGIVTSLPVSISLSAPPSSPSHHMHQSQHQMMGPPMVAMVTAAPSPNQGMQNIPGSSPPVSVVTSSTGMGPAGQGTILSVVTGTPGGIVNNQVTAKEDSGISPAGDVGMNNMGDGSGSMMVVSEERRNGETSPAPGVTPMEGVVETGIAASQSSDVSVDKEKMANGVAEPSTGSTVSIEGANSGEDGGGAKNDSISTGVGSSGLANGPTSGTTLTGMVVGTSRDTHKLPPPKALVKPQVLTHVIEGFVIQEASEPFAVNRSSLLSEMPQPSLKSNNQMMQNHAQQQPGAQDKENVQHHLMSNHMMVPSSNESEEPPKKKLAQEVQVGVPQTAKLPADLAKCEFCGKVDLRSKFKKSKRFCTLACAKRFNVGCSKRSGLYKPEEATGKKGTHAVDANNVTGVMNAANAKDQQGKADWQKSKGQEWHGNQVVAGQDGGRLGTVGVTSQEESSHTTDNETNDSSGAESSSLSPSEIIQGQDSTSARTSGIATGDPSDDNNSSESGPLLSGGQVNATPSTPPQPRINPIKWTVSDVCEFIRNLPGCSDYAEDFAIQEIDGQALLLLKEDHLMTAMSMKLGPALKICARIDTMRGDMKEK